MSSSEVYVPRSAARRVDPRSVVCPECGAPAGRPCGAVLVAGPQLFGDYSRGRSHIARIRDAVTAEGR